MEVRRVHVKEVAAAAVLAAVCLAAAFAPGQQLLAPGPPPPPPLSPAVTPPTQDLPAVQETLQDAWRAALDSDQQIASSQCSLLSARSSFEAARAEQFPSLNLGADYFALSQQPGFRLNLSPLPATQMSFIERDSGGFHGFVTQPIFTSGQISSGIRAAGAAVDANQADVDRTRLDVKMRVAEIYVSVLRAARLVEVADSKVASLASHRQVVNDHFVAGVVPKNDLPPPRSPWPTPANNGWKPATATK